ncbi:hypothetical protein M441DRAFT_70290 [Trichoderma asperellum CBS 433.97]|uniref:Uncharacterized protein n=1 Tax=Trichoderma asperellum (strain ATCC 204424 / CBS 433.97 / NBRC 101777) TaxID=1042311 RepID=A0A2T3Z2W6_TRIA4|nr:hypothetical protein M441DRAFT_70290 [Trichoderma asperellum CBS 433.97]PTB39145.1 hypothetical protein M441DRAFT_70290 [Trichoderma asperellum CBS 433.97]
MAVNSKKDIAYEPIYSDSSSKSFESVLHDEDEHCVIEYEQVMFQGHLDHKSIYKGTPNKAMDKAWDDLMYMNGTVVDAKVIDRIGKSRYVEVFHQLHCLYYDHLENRQLTFEDPEHILRKRVDHCIDVLRQVLSCNTDVGLITYNWVEHYGIFPDFSTQHKCRKLDNIFKWVDTHQ